KMQPNPVEVWMLIDRLQQPALDVIICIASDRSGRERSGVDRRHNVGSSSTENRCAGEAVKDLLTLTHHKLVKPGQKGVEGVGLVIDESGQNLHRYGSPCRSVSRAVVVPTCQLARSILGCSRYIFRLDRTMRSNHTATRRMEPLITICRKADTFIRLI